MTDSQVARALASVAAELARLAAELAQREPPPSQEPDKMLDATEVARRLGISVEAVYRKNLPFRVKVSGRCTRWPEKALEEWLAEKRTP